MLITTMGPMLLVQMKGLHHLRHQPSMNVRIRLAAQRSFHQYLEIMAQPHKLPSQRVRLMMRLWAPKCSEMSHDWLGKYANGVPYTRALAT